MAIAASVLVRVQFMSRRRYLIETSSPRKMPIRDMHRETPFSISSFGKVKTRAAAPATKSRNSGFGLRLVALAYNSLLNFRPAQPSESSLASGGDRKMDLA